LADTKSAEESAPSPVLYDIGEGDSPESVKAPEPKREEKSFGVNFSKERVFIPHKLDETVAMDHFTPVKPEDFAAEKEIESSADDEATTEGGLPIDLSPTAEIKPLSADNPGGVRYGEPEKDPDVYGQQPGTSPYDAPAANSAPTKPVSAGAPKSSPENDVTTGMHKSYVRFTCRKCGTKSVVDVDAAKEVVTCKNCGKAMRLKLKNG
jgi:ribosomal protein S27E